MKKAKSSQEKFTVTAKDIPATQGMLHLVRSELKSDISEFKSEMKAQFKGVDARFNKLDARFNEIEAKLSGHDSKFSSIDARFNQVDARFNQVDARFNQVDARFEEVIGAIHGVSSDVARLSLLVEEQNSRNLVVLEGLTGLFQRQDRVETRMDQTENLVKSIVRKL